MQAISAPSWCGVLRCTATQAPRFSELEPLHFPIERSHGCSHRLPRTTLLDCSRLTPGACETPYQTYCLYRRNVCLCQGVLLPSSQFIATSHGNRVFIWGGRIITPLQPFNHRAPFEPWPYTRGAEVMNALPERPFRHFVPNSLRRESQASSQIFDLEVLFGGHYCFYKVTISGDQGSLCCCGLSISRLMQTTVASCSATSTESILLLWLISLLRVGNYRAAAQ